MDLLKHAAVSVMMTAFGVAIIFHIDPLRSLITGIKVGQGNTPPAGTTGALYM